MDSHITKEALEMGDYYRREDIQREYPRIIEEWDAWLDVQRDPGNYDAYKDRTKHPPEWVCDTFMPPYLVKKMFEEGDLNGQNDSMGTP